MLLAIEKAEVTRSPNVSNKLDKQLLTVPRALLFLFSFIYALTLHWAHQVYLHPVHAFWGFPFSQYGIQSWFFMLLSIGLACTVIPIQLVRASVLIIFLLFVVVYIPSIVITLAATPDALGLYGWHLTALVIGFLIACMLTRFFARSNASDINRYNVSGISRGTCLFFITVHIFLLVFLFYSFYGIINFVSLEEIYNQRIAGRARNAIEAYSQTYMGYVIAPAVYAIGLIKKNIFILALGLSGFFLLFGITAERTVFLMPLAMTLMYLIPAKKANSDMVLNWILLLMSMLIATAVIFREAFNLIDSFALYYVFRTIAIPGAMFWQYADVFSHYGWTYWSNISGLGLLAPLPAALVNDSHWPQLGYIVADEILGLESNSNANPFAYDGLAAAGPIGIICISLLITLWLIAFDFATKKSHVKFVFLVTLPGAIVLTNGSFFSYLLSFGGFFWIVYFALSSTRFSARTLKD